MEPLLEAATADSDSHHPAIILININTQILVVPAEDIPRDSLFLCAEILTIPGNLMNVAVSVKICSFFMNRLTSAELMVGRVHSKLLRLKHNSCANRIDSSTLGKLSAMSQVDALQRHGYVLY